MNDAERTPRRRGASRGRSRPAVHRLSATEASLTSGLRSDRQQASERLVIRPAPRGRPVPLALAQERFWFLHQLDPASPADNVAAALRIDGWFDVDAFRQTWDTIVRRHEILRTRFVAEGGQPVQVIDPPRPALFEFTDLRDVPAEARFESAVARAGLDADRPFDLELGPAYRLALYRLDEDSVLFVPVFHHIVCDLWSLGVLSHELGELYSAIVEGREPRLAEPLLQYADYAVSHRQWVEGPGHDDQLEYWRTELSGIQSQELPADRPRQATAGIGDTGKVDLAPELLSEVKSFAGSQGATPFMVLIAAYTYLLARYTGQSDVVVGTPIANRPRLELKGMVGTFVNTLAFRTNTATSRTFRELLARVRQTALDAFAHQDISFHHLVTALRPERPQRGAMFFQTLFNVQNAPIRVPALAGTTVEHVTLPRRAAQFDLTVWVETSVLRQVGFSYDTSLFDRETVERLVAHYLRLLQTVVREPDRPLAEIELLTPAERATVLHEWNQTAATLSAQTVPEMVDEQAKRLPHAIAVESGAETLTYGELVERSKSLSEILRTRGLGPGSVVGLCVERGVGLVAALLGVMRSGAAYLPLDPAFPPDRLAYMVRDAAVSLIVSERAFADRFPQETPVLLLSGAAGGVEERESDASGRVPALDETAYVMYTSGSTGRPKGVEISHGALANFLQSMRRRPGISESDKLLAVTTLSFDIAGLELFLPLITGATVVVADRDDCLDPYRLARLIDERGITTMQATPTMWSMLVESGWEGKGGLTILCGGEPLTRGLADRLLDRGKVVWNLYGPTETTIWSTVGKVTAGSAPVSIGRPIANTELYILDPNGLPVPIGVPGELFIGGAGVALGYKGRADLTAERFLPDPFRGGGRRMYRTGDRARYLRDGQVELLGRADNQVKVRGFRVELGEVEAALSMAPGVAMSAVVARRAPGGEARLVAFVVPDLSAPATANELRERVASELPPYMVPSRFVFVPSLPTTPNGKIDRAALPGLPDEVYTPEDAEPPATDVERRLAAIWAEELDLPSVGALEDFFDLGGHSLLAVKVAARIRNDLGRSLPVASLLENRTVRQLAREIERRVRNSPG